jgi:hypothetical protein
MRWFTIKKCILQHEIFSKKIHHPQIFQCVGSYKMGLAEQARNTETKYNMIWWNNAYQLENFSYK